MRGNQVFIYPSSNIMAHMQIEVRILILTAYLSLLLFLSGVIAIAGLPDSQNPSESASHTPEEYGLRFQSYLAYN